MQVSPFPGDALAGVAGTTHCCDDFTCFLDLTNLNAGRDFTQMSVQRIHWKTVDVVPHDNIITVVGQAGPGVDISDGASSGRAHRIDRFTFGITLYGFDVETFVHLPALGADTAEGAAWPSAPYSGREIVGLLASHKNRLVRGRKAERLPKRAAGMPKSSGD